MPRLTPTQYRGTPIDIDHESFGEAEVNRVLAAIGDAFPLLIDRELFRERLNSIAKWHRVVLAANTEPTEAADREYLVDLLRTARRLVHLLPLGAVPDDDEGRFAPEPPHGVLRLLDAPMAVLIEQRLSDERSNWLKRQDSSHVLPAVRRTSPPALSATDIFGGAALTPDNSSI